MHATPISILFKLRDVVVPGEGLRYYLRCCFVVNWFTGSVGLDLVDKPVPILVDGDAFKFWAEPLVVFLVVGAGVAEAGLGGYFGSAVVA